MPRKNRQLNPSSNPNFIVGIGASAGGIESLVEFLKNLPKNFESPLVIVQHMSPDFKTMLPEILSRQTGHTVRLASDGVLVSKGEIYLIPPDKMMSIFHGKLLLKPREESNPACFFPIDHFFESLAEELGERSVALILSGTGSDGTKGAKAIKKKGGYVIVLSPDDSRFSGMPRSAIEAKTASVVLCASDIPKHIDQYTSGIKVKNRRAESSETVDRSHALDRVFLQLKSQFGLDFSNYHDDLIERRMERRAKIAGCQSAEEYCAYVVDNAKELPLLYDDLLLGVTEFNRHPDCLEKLKQLVFPELVNISTDRDCIRAWVVGCSTGEEPFTLAFLLDELLIKAKTSLDYKIFATDVDDKALKIASRGSYPAEKIKDLPSRWRDNYFKMKDGQAYIKTKIRERVIFANHNVIRDAPFPNIDLISCRNLMIYLKKSAKDAIYHSFQFSLRGKGFLLLGPSESLPASQRDFVELDTQAKIYKCTNAGRSFSSRSVALSSELLKNGLLSIATRKPPEGKTSFEDYESKLHAKLVKDHMPASLVFNEDGKINYFFGNIKDFLVPMHGKASHQISDVLPDELSDLLLALKEKVTEEGHAAESLLLPVAEGQSQVISVELFSLNIDKKGEKQYLAKFFQTESKIDKKYLEKSIPSAVQAKNSRLLAALSAAKKEIQETKSEMLAMVGQLEASNEELRTTNEELQAGSEELQSTNEELQAVNEELYTVNAECQMRITELSEMSSDVQNIYEVSEIGTLFVDKELRIRKFNSFCQRIFNLLPDDIGRPIENFSSKLKIDFAKKAQLVMQVGKIQEKDVRSIDGIDYLMRIAPYKTDDLQVKGAVIVFIDISALKATQSKLSHASDELEMVSQETSDLVVRFDTKGRILYGNDSFFQYFGLDGGTEEIRNKCFSDFIHPDSRLESEKKLLTWRRDKVSEDNFFFKHVTSDGSIIDVAWHTKTRFDQRGTPRQFVSIGRIAN